MATSSVQARPLIGTGAALIRVSSKRQDVVRQREAIAQWLRWRGLDVPPDFIDDGRSFAALLRKLDIKLYEDK